MLLQRLRMYWEGDKKWFSGTIVAHDVANNIHTIKYDDGEQRGYQLHSSENMWEPLDESGLRSVEPQRQLQSASLTPAQISQAEQIRQVRGVAHARASPLSVPRDAASITKALVREKTAQVTKSMGANAILEAMEQVMHEQQEVEELDEAYNLDELDGVEDELDDEDDELDGVEDEAPGVRAGSDADDRESGPLEVLAETDEEGETDEANGMGRQAVADGQPDEQLYEVERLLDVTGRASTGRRYRVRWRGYDKTCDTWEPAENLPPELIAGFLEQRAQKPTTSETALRNRVKARMQRLGITVEQLGEQVDYDCSILDAWLKSSGCCTTQQKRERKEYTDAITPRLLAWVRLRPSSCAPPQAPTQSGRQRRGPEKFDPAPVKRGRSARAGLGVAKAAKRAGPTPSAAVPSAAVARAVSVAATTPSVRAAESGGAAAAPSLWLRSTAGRKRSRVGLDFQVNPLKVYVADNGPTTGPRCRCDRDCEWARGRWWCAAGDRGCGFESEQPGVDERVPLCACNQRAVLLRRHWWCALRTSGCGFIERQATSESPWLQSKKDTDVEHAKAMVPPPPPVRFAHAPCPAAHPTHSSFSRAQPRAHKRKQHTHAPPCMARRRQC